MVLPTVCQGYSSALSGQLETIALNSDIQVRISLQLSPRVAYPLAHCAFDIYSAERSMADVLLAQSSTPMSNYLGSGE